VPKETETLYHVVQNSSFCHGSLVG